MTDKRNLKSVQRATLRPALFALSAIASAAAVQAQAQDSSAAPVQLDPVVVSVERSRQSSFDAPAAITAITREVIDNGGMQVNLSEVLNRVPGVTVLNRQNYAQDLQLSIRGFGARSTFGIRGVRLIVDGIPATMPDGQGQASNIALGSASRIEVLRGPLAQLYGNAAGGVVQIFTDAGAPIPTAEFSYAAGPYGQSRSGLKFSASNAVDALTLDVSQFNTDGYRDHSEARRSQFNGKWVHELGNDGRLSFVLNILDQPLSKDPLGLVLTDFESNPRQVTPIANSQDSRKTVAQQQAGVVLEQRLGAATLLTARLYAGARQLDNALGLPLSAQTSDTSSGGIVKLERQYGGLGVQLAHSIKLDSGQTLRLTGGVDLDRLNEDRQGFINSGGVAGARKRDESNSVQNQDFFAQAAFDLSSQWTATAGVRSSRVKFNNIDHFIVLPRTTSPTAPGNPDDSGGVDYSATNPVLGLAWRAAPELNLYANAGQGFETPTFAELSYRPSPATGLNTALRASRSRHAEVGAKWKLSPTQRIDAAVFDITTEDEIVVDVNTGGRSTFKNAGRTKRSGLELQYAGQFGADWRVVASLTAMRARFADSFVSGSGAAALVVPSGNHLPGVAERSAFAELAWAPRGAWGGFNAGVEMVYSGGLYFNDINKIDAADPGTRATDATTLLNLRAGFAQKSGDWTFTQLLRLDNATDRRYAGSVIVNEANKRFFEPALPRNWLLAVNAKVEFR